MPDAAFDRARYRRILRFALRVLLSTWWFEIALPTVGLRRIAERTRSARVQKIARRFRLLAVDLGGLMIKLGQFLSSRLDVLPVEITRELEGLQDEVPAVPFAAIRELAEADLGVPLTQVFAHIDDTPIAAASLGQVYRARLENDDARVAGFDRVVVKVQRPGIDAIVNVDLAALRKVGEWLSRVRLVARRVDAPALVEEFSRISLEEIDYLHEAASSERFAANFADDPRVRVPEVVWERSTRRVLTLEDVSAIKISDIDGLRAVGIDPAQVSQAFSEIMFDQVFVHAFVHGDPHPGNLFVDPGDKDEGEPPFSLVFVDFGMMGTIAPALRSALRSVVIAAAARDGAGMVRAMSSAGVLLPTADTREIERVMSQVFARFGGMSMSELREVDPREFRDFALEFRDVILALPFQLPEDFLLVMRSMSLTSGVATALNPRYNVWDTVEPYAQRLVSAEGENLVGDLAREAVDVAGVAWRLPRRIDSVLSRAEDGSLPLAAPRLEAAATRLDRTGRRLTWAVVFTGLLLAGAVLSTDGSGLGTWLMIASVLPLGLAVFGGRSQR